MQPVLWHDKLMYLFTCYAYNVFGEALFSARITGLLECIHRPLF
jgi:hypothetical protein